MIRVWARAVAAASARWSSVIRSGRTAWPRGVIVLLASAALVAAASVGAALVAIGALHHI